MSGFLAIFRRELAGLFLQPLAWILLAVALLIQGWLFTFMLRFDGDVVGSLRVALGGSAIFWALLGILAPLLTMRSISEEARSGLLEYLLTAPVSDAAVVTGKAAAATAFFAILWASALAYAAVLAAFGVAIDWPALLFGYLGAVVLSGLFCSIGIFCSALSATPALAAFLAFAINLVFLVGPQLNFLREHLDQHTLRAITSKFDMLERFGSSFLRGAFDSAHLVFFLAWTAAFLFLAVRTVEVRRWR